MAEYKGSWPVEKLVEYINNGRQADAAIQSLIALHDGSRKVRKKPSKKDATTALTLPTKPEPSDEILGSEDFQGDAVTSATTQFRNIVQESLKNGDVLNDADSAFVTPRSSSSDFPDFLFLDDISLARKEEEFKVVKRKKMKSSNLLDKSSSASDSRLSHLEACKEILAGRVVGQCQEMFFLPKLESCSSFSISVSTFESRSSSVRSASPANSNLSDCIVKDVSIPKTVEDVPLQFLAHPTLSSSEDYTISIPGINLHEVLQLETQKRNSGVDFSTSEQYVETRTDICCANSEQPFALSNETNVFLLSPVFPDIVTSTISELPDSMRTDICQRNLTWKSSTQLPQPGDITTGESLLSSIPEDGIFQESSAEKPNPLSEIAFGDVPSGALFSQDFKNCDMTFPTKNPAQERSAVGRSEPHLKAQAARDVSACCRKPVVFLDSLGDDVVCDLGISFVFEDGDVSDVGFCHGSDRENNPTKVSRLPDLVNPFAVLFGPCDADARDLGHATDDIGFEFCSIPLSSANGSTCHVDGQTAPAPASTSVGSLIGSTNLDFRPESPLVIMETSPWKSSILSKPTTWNRRSGRKRYHNRCAYFRSANEDCLTAPLHHTAQEMPNAIDNTRQCEERGFDLHEAQLFLEESKSTARSMY